MLADVSREDEAAEDHVRGGGKEGGGKEDWEGLQNCRPRGRVTVCKAKYVLVWSGADVCLKDVSRFGRAYE